MKVRYINILLFALQLNILVYNQMNHKSTAPHTLKIPTTRLLCECELYMPNYDNDPQMRKVIDNFNKRTQQRFHEYDEHMKEKRQECKDQCDKEIQKIILKDKLEKQMEEQLTTLETKITTDDIPTCICEKSLADKMEKGCLRCGGVLGGGVMPGFGTIGGSALYVLNLLKPAAIIAAKKAALAEATDLATEAGINAVISKINVWNIDFMYDTGFVDFSSVVSKLNFKSATALHESAMALASSKSCDFGVGARTPPFCSTILYGDKTTFPDFAKAGAETYKTILESQTTTLTNANVDAVNATYGGYQTAIIAPIVAIVVIILIMVIIYLILRYRRKKKMKKKLQYIKLLEE
ncbi:rifin [Plasmodium reichenowi]|uniref:Rifin n=1 Tax=Plasmodium reichenowi TaxID=5854 RepID=A0A060RQW0_PLARE|nr:rifin [Plasmodium reichenowi]